MIWNRKSIHQHKGARWELGIQRNICYSGIAYQLVRFIGSGMCCAHFYTYSQHLQGLYMLGFRECRNNIYRNWGIESWRITCKGTNVTTMNDLSNNNNTVYLLDPSFSELPVFFGTERHVWLSRWWLSLFQAYSQGSTANMSHQLATLVEVIKPFLNNEACVEKHVTLPAVSTWHLACLIAILTWGVTSRLRQTKRLTFDLVKTLTSGKVVNGGHSR